MKKKPLRILLITFCFVCIGIFSACSCSGNKTGIDESKTVNTEMTLNVNQKNIKLLENFYIVPEYIAVFGQQLEFVSSNEEVATVSKEGNVVGVGVGDANITVKYGAQQAVCAVNVSYDMVLPVVIFNSISETKTQVTIQEGTRLNLASHISYKLNDYEDHEVTYTVSNPSAGAMDGCEFVANTLSGSQQSLETEITVKATWKGLDGNTVPSLIRDIKVVITKGQAYADSYILINDSIAYPDKITLYTAHEIDGTLFANTYDLVCRDVNAGTKSENADNVDIRIDGNCIKIENEKIKVLSTGTATINVSITNAPANASQDLVNIEIDVEVLTPFVKNNTLINKVSAVDGFELPMSELTEPVTKVIQNEGSSNEKELTLEGGKWMGLETEANKVTDTTISVYMQNYGYYFDVQAYTKILKNEADLDVLKIKNAENGKVVGSYLVDGDITVTNKFESISDYTFVANYTNYTKGFCGYFDGNGKTITFNELGANGIFGRIQPGATVRNADFEIKSIKAVDSENNPIADRCNALAFAVAGSGNSANSYITNVAVRLTPNEENTITDFDGIVSNAMYNANISELYVSINDNVKLSTNNNVANGIIFSNAKDMGGSTERLLSKNIVVLSPTEKFLAKDENISVYASNDEAYDSNDAKHKQAKNASIYTNTTDLMKIWTKVGDWKINADGTVTYDG